MSDSDLGNPHDKFFKEAFSRPEVARDFLTQQLPSAVLAQIDLDTLELQKDTFVDSELAEHFSDMLYRVQTRAETAVYIYLLLEHKSYPDPFIALQLLRYLVRIWEQDLREKRKQLRLVLPLVVYHGKSGGYLLILRAYSREMRRYGRIGPASSTSSTTSPATAMPIYGVQL